MSKPTAPWRDRLSLPLALHLAATALLTLLVIGLAVRVGLDWSASSSDASATKNFQLKALELQTAPLRGLDKRVDDSRAQILNFYKKRVPASYSAIAARIGELSVSTGARLTRAQYAQAAAGSDLSEVALDMSISGAYPQIMRFVNSLERDPNFFVVRSMALNEQQGGQVNLRLRVSTWMRPADAAALPPADQDKNDKSKEGN